MPDEKKFITMKKLFIASLIAGAAVVGLLYYLQDTFGEKKTADEIGDAAEDTYDTMNKHIGRVERKFDHALN